MSSASELVHAFMDAWGTRDIDAIMAFFSEDAAYANVPMGPPNVGKAAIREFIEGFLGTTSCIEFVVHHQAEGADGIVMNERTDKLTMGGNTIELPVMGVFEIRDGKVAAWRDYFDMSAFAGAT